MPWWQSNRYNMFVKSRKIRFNLVHHNPLMVQFRLAFVAICTVASVKTDLHGMKVRNIYNIHSKRNYFNYTAPNVHQNQYCYCNLITEMIAEFHCVCRTKQLEKSWTFIVLWPFVYSPGAIIPLPTRSSGRRYSVLLQKCLSFLFFLSPKDLRDGSTDREPL